MTPIIIDAGEFFDCIIFMISAYGVGRWEANVSVQTGVSIPSRLYQHIQGSCLITTRHGLSAWWQADQALT